jgi:hypothetical protein
MNRALHQARAAREVLQAERLISVPQRLDHRKDLPDELDIRITVFHSTCQNVFRCAEYAAGGRDVKKISKEKALI